MTQRARGKKMLKYRLIRIVDGMWEAHRLRQQFSNIS